MLIDFKNINALVVGDFIVDEYITGDTTRLSPEAPIPIVLKKNSQYSWGGAGNVYKNARSLGANAHIICVVGNDDLGRRNMLGEPSDIFIPENGRPTTLKTRIVANGQQIVRIDEESTSPISKESESALNSCYAKMATICEAIIVQDYGKGVITRGVVDNIVSLRNVENNFLAWDPHPSNKDLIPQGLDLLKPNLKEAQSITGRLNAREAFEEIERLYCPRYLVMTMGKDGMMTRDDSGNIITLQARDIEVFDVCGAGDTAIAVLTLAMSSGMSIKDAVNHANFAASIAVRHNGTYNVGAAELNSAANDVEYTCEFRS
jgi:D-beta-D-heptose 7-phosphate kinase/D-beta-D-heptose 1-phosphate adenosyltransferase